MRRDEARELLIDYLDGTLPAGERSALDALLAQDAELRDEVEALREAEAAVHALPKINAPKDFLTRLNAAIDAQAGASATATAARAPAAPPAASPAEPDRAAAPEGGGNGSHPGGPPGETAAGAPASPNVIRARMLRAPPRAFAMAAMLLLGVGIGVLYQPFMQSGARFSEREMSVRSATGSAATSAPAAAAVGPATGRAFHADDVTLALDVERGKAAWTRAERPPAGAAAAPTAPEHAPFTPAPAPVPTPAPIFAKGAIGFKDGGRDLPDARGHGKEEFEKAPAQRSLGLAEGAQVAGGGRYDGDGGSEQREGEPAGGVAGKPGDAPASAYRRAQSEEGSKSADERGREQEERLAGRAPAPPAPMKQKAVDDVKKSLDPARGPETIVVAGAATRETAGAAPAPTRPAAPPPAPPAPEEAIEAASASALPPEHERATGGKPVAAPEPAAEKETFDAAGHLGAERAERALAAAEAAVAAEIEAQRLREDDLLAALALAEASHIAAEAREQRDRRDAEEDALASADKIAGERRAQEAGTPAAGGKDGTFDSEKADRGLIAKVGESAKRREGDEEGKERGAASASTSPGAGTATPAAGGEVAGTGGGGGDVGAAGQGFVFGATQLRSNLRVGATQLASAPRATLVRLSGVDAGNARQQLEGVFSGNGVQNFALITADELAFAGVPVPSEAQPATVVAVVEGDAMQSLAVLDGVAGLGRVEWAGEGRAGRAAVSAVTRALENRVAMRGLDLERRRAQNQAEDDETRERRLLAAREAAASAARAEEQRQRRGELGGALTAGLTATAAAQGPVASQAGKHASASQTGPAPAPGADAPPASQLTQNQADASRRVILVIEVRPDVDATGALLEQRRAAPAAERKAKVEPPASQK